MTHTQKKEEEIHAVLDATGALGTTPHKEAIDQTLFWFKSHLLF
jgi:hypothetical protein